MILFLRDYYLIGTANVMIISNNQAFTNGFFTSFVTT